MQATTPPVVVIRPDPEGFAVVIEPPLPDGQDHARTFWAKADAWGYARSLWEAHRLGARDELISNVVQVRTPRGPYRKRGSKLRCSAK